MAAAKIYVACDCTNRCNHNIDPGKNIRAVLRSASHPILIRATIVSIQIYCSEPDAQRIPNATVGW